MIMAQQLNYTVEKNNTIGSAIVMSEKNSADIDIKALNIIEFDDF